MGKALKGKAWENMLSGTLGKGSTIDFQRDQHALPAAFDNSTSGKIRDQELCGRNGEVHVLSLMTPLS